MWWFCVPGHALILDTRNVSRHMQLTACLSHLTIDPACPWGRITYKEGVEDSGEQT